jgi:very-short-patch-repair endonuclease
LSRQPSHLEKRFALYWRALDGPALVPEHKVCDGRRFRFDFADPVSRVAIEVEGGVWTAGRHTRGTGYGKDCEKYNEAGFGGWQVFRFTADMITVPNLERLVRFVRLRRSQTAQ